MEERQLINVINGIQIKDEMRDKILQKVLDANITNKNWRKYSYSIFIVICISIMIIILIPTLGQSKTISYSIDTANISLDVNELEGEPNDTVNGIALLLDDFVPMKESEILKYYNVSLSIDKVLPYLKKDKSNKKDFGIYKRKTGEIYFDNNTFRFKNDNGSQLLSILIAKGSIPYIGFTNIFEEYNSNLKQSNVNGVEITVAHFIDSDGINKYYAGFILNGNGYRIYSTNLPLDDFTKVLATLVD